MESTLLSALSPQLQALVEASLGAKLPSSTTATLPSDGQPRKSSERMESAKNQRPKENNPQLVNATLSSSQLNPSELFALKHPEAPGFVVKENFLGEQNALAVQDALAEVAQSEPFHEAKVGAGDNSRNDRAVRGDRIHWIKMPRDLKASTSEDGVSPAILHLRRQVESLVFGLKKVSPELDLRNVVSTQLAIFPGDGARFVKHLDTNPNAQRDEYGTNKDGLVRLVTSLDVEHEVLPTHQERMAITIWYYGKAKQNPDNSSHTDPTVNLGMTALPPLPSTNGGSADLVEKMSIFVSIPSYRDSECRHTIDDLYAKATFPGRISVGIYLQTDETDTTRAYLESKYSSSKVRVHCVDYRDAAGPCVARAHAQKLWQGEKYHLQIDSHMRFRPGWDCFLISELESCPSTKPILTTYPLGYTLPNEVSSECRPTLLCATSFDNRKLLRQTGKVLAKKAAVPIPSLFWAAGYAFSSSHVIKEVPYDETLRFLFFGEEISMAARLWTSGWDFFAPSETAVYHLWTRAHRPVFQELESDELIRCRMASVQYVKRLLNVDNSTTEDSVSGVGKFGLGSERTLECYEKHIGVNFGAGDVDWRSQWGNLDPIQFDLTNTAGNAFLPS
ncbi:Egl nine 3 [Phytophthora boehmeriae]|uniref:Egl nine 3 n=1 Tax=Phytophthora boehmeriae TaxID=109152 RepID=A0A8T1WC13_9STRA|nr:Egl nine 3 [Phytophthora boehmeriae]